MLLLLLFMFFWFVKWLLLAVLNADVVVGINYESIFLVKATLRDYLIIPSSNIATRNAEIESIDSGISRITLRSTVTSQLRSYSQTPNENHYNFTPPPPLPDIDVRSMSGSGGGGGYFFR